MQGVLRGTGKQLSGAVVNFVSYYIVGLPTGTLLAILAGMGARGMWIGLLLASVLQVRERGAQTLSCDGHVTIG